MGLWPWKSDTAESFEKTLSALATKISSTSAHNDRLRQRARKLKVGWTLYGGFAYILAFLILTLVTGWQNWGPMELSVVAGGPVLLYVVRSSLTRWYNYRISNSQDSLERLYKERDETIEKLKQATKYNSTQQLLEKYGGGSKRPADTGASPISPGRDRRRSDRVDHDLDVQQRPQNAMFVNPPPTANIQRPPTSQLAPLAAQPSPRTPRHSASPPPQRGSPAGPPITEEFAPNAFSHPPPPNPRSSVGAFPPQSHASSPRWYDRIFDALLGEDETQARNRLALVCDECRLVNGLAPPGIRTPEEMGRWKCGGCGAWNGEQAEGERLVKKVLEEGNQDVAQDENSAKDGKTKAEITNA